MDDIAKLEERERALASQIKALEIQRQQVSEDLTNARSRQWVEANEVTIDMVQLSSGPRVPCFDYFGKFIDWVRSKGPPYKPYIEWNNSIHLTSEAMDGPFFRPTRGLIEHVRERTERLAAAGKR